MNCDPWESISRADHPGVDNVRVADPSHPLLFRRGKDFQGRYLFFLEGRRWNLESKDLPRLSGIDVDLINIGSEQERLVLTLLEHDQKEIFRALCLNLTEATRHLDRNDTRKGVGIVVNRIRRWQDLLKKRTAGTLSKPQIIGLIGELLFLRDVLLLEMPLSDAVNSWTGPFGSEQDFALDHSAVEVKTQIVTADKKIKISSEHQLDARSAPILIWHLLLGVSTESDPNGLSLNSLVLNLKEVIVEGPVAAIDVFNTALMEVGYWPRPEYDDLYWTVIGDQFIEVGDGFPAITPADLTLGVHEVSYSIDLERCLGFVLTDCEARERLFNAKA